MRKSNNVKQWSRDDSNSFWLVFDVDTDETLTFYDDDDLNKCEWQSLIIEAGIGGHLEKIEDLARFDSVEDAQVAARNLVDHLLEIYPDEDVNLVVRQVLYETTEMVTDLRTVMVVESSNFEREQDAERFLDLMSKDGEEEEEEDENPPAHGVYSGAFSDEVFLGMAEEEEEEEETPKKKPKAKKSARSKPKAKPAKKSRA